MKKNIKKVFVSLLVIIGFAFYGIFQRFGDGFQKFFDNLQTKQVAAESYQDLSISSSKNQTSADPPLNSSKNMNVIYPELPVLPQADQGYKNPSAVSYNISLYKDGEYDGQAVDAYYGFVQVKAIIESGKLADIQFLSYPDNKSYSIEINKQAMPVLEASAIKNQSAQVDIFAGATNTSKAFMISLGSALSKASTSTATGNSFLQTTGSSVDIVSGATNVATGLIGTFTVQNQGAAVDIISGATNVSSVTTVTDGTAIQNQGTSVNIVSGATNVSSVTTVTDGTAIQNQETSVDIVSGATSTAVSSDTDSDDEDDAEYSDDDSDDENENDSDDENDDEHDSENEEWNEGDDD